MFSGSVVSGGYVKIMRLFRLYVSRRMSKTTRYNVSGALLNGRHSKMTWTMKSPQWRETKEEKKIQRS